MWYNRPIKFRGRRVDNGEYIYGDLMHFQNGTVAIDILKGGIFPVDPETVAQLAGYDKDGNEVYEGDVMGREGDKSPFIVILKPQGCVFHEDNGRRYYSSIYFDMIGRNAINKFTVKNFGN